MRLTRLDAHLAFPPPETALSDPNGLLAIGGDLSQERLLLAYRSGIFPWFSPGDPILWWSPDPRCVFFPRQFKPHQRFTRFLKQSPWTITINKAFGEVIERCAHIKRKHQRGTWITAAMINAYVQLHAAGHAHSIEAWQDNRLIGGLYGVAVGRVFFGESMFSEISNGSKTVLTFLCAFLRRHDYALLDCQVPNPHLLSLGAIEMQRHEFLSIVRNETLHTMALDIWHKQSLPHDYWLPTAEEMAR